MGADHADRWIENHGELREEHRDGARVGCEIVKALRGMVVVLALYSPDDIEGGFPESNAKLAQVLACAKAIGHDVIDTRPPIVARLGPTRDSRETVYRDLWLYPADPHLSPSGAKFVADLVARAVIPKFLGTSP
jgi:hypothetical protein